MLTYDYDRHCQAKEINKTGPRATAASWRTTNCEEEVGHVYSMETIENKLRKLLARVKYRWVSHRQKSERGDTGETVIKSKLKCEREMLDFAYALFGGSNILCEELGAEAAQVRDTRPVTVAKLCDRQSDMGTGQSSGNPLGTTSRHRHKRRATPDSGKDSHLLIESVSQPAEEGAYCKI